MNSELQKAESELHGPMTALAAKASELRRTGNSSQVSELSSKVKHLDSQVEAATQAISAIYSNIYDVYTQTTSQLTEIEWLLDQVDQASFNILADEHPVQAVQARWWRDGEGKGPEGILFLTDQRLIFEQKEEVATKKVLFITTEKELVQGLQLEIPLGLMRSVKATSQGFMKHEDHLDCEFETGAPYPKTHFHIKGQDSEFWAGLLKRVQVGQIITEKYYTDDKDRQADQQAFEEVLTNAPQKCTSCGASLPPIATGQRQVKCDYCNSTMRW
jgi:hypothetical protein